MKRIVLSLFAFIVMAGIASAQTLNAAQTKLRNEIRSFLQEEGFMPSIDKDGDVAFKKEGHTFWVSVSDEDTNPMYVTIGTAFSNPGDYSLSSIMQAAADINLFKGVKVLCDEDSFAIQGELYLGNAEQFKYSFYTILNQIDNALLAFDDACQAYQNGSGGGSSGTTGSSSGRSSYSSEPRVVNYPSIRSRGDNKLVFKRVIIADTYTALEMSTNNNHGGSYYTWCQIAKGTHLICGGKNYAMINADGIKITPERTYFSGENSTIDFTLYFEPIPRNASTIDFYEDSGSSWNTWGISLGGSSSSTSSSVSRNVQRTARIESVNVEHNQYKDGVKGMKIHVKFNIQNCKGESCRCIAYFYNENGDALKDTNSLFCDVGGNVCTAEDFSPSYDSSSFSDLELWIPNSELHINTSSRKVSCFFLVRLYDFDISDFIDASYRVSFTIG